MENQFSKDCFEIISEYHHTIFDADAYAGL